MSLPEPSKRISRPVSRSRSPRRSTAAPSSARWAPNSCLGRATCFIWPVAAGMGAEGGGDLFSQAVAIVKRDRKASTSYIQRRLQIGYNRAASLMERMEQEGIVGQANHAGKREILVEEEESRF